jgi:hypothetical protein
MNNAHLQTNALSPPQSPQPISPLHYSGNHTHHHLKYLEQLLDSSLATVAVIQFSGNNTLADVLTPRTHDTFKALYALAALDAPASTRSTKPGGNEIPTFSDIGKDCPYSSNRSPPLPNSSPTVPGTGRIYISISLDHVMHFSCTGLAAVTCLVVLLILPRVCEGIFRT